MATYHVHPGQSISDTVNNASPGDIVYLREGTFTGELVRIDNLGTEANPIYTYTEVGTFQTTLTVTDNNNATHSDVVTIDVVDGTTIWGGIVSGTWTAAGSPYLIEGDIVIPAGKTLTIEPGVEVVFQSWYKLTVNGTLLAEGTASAPVLFTGTHPTAGWLGIRFINAPDGSRLTHVIVEKGRATGASPDNSGGGIYIENSNPVISNSTIRDNFAKRSGGGIYLTNSNATLIDNTIVNNSAGQGSSAFGGGIYSFPFHMGICYFTGKAQNYHPVYYG